MKQSENLVAVLSVVSINLARRPSSPPSTVPHAMVLVTNSAPTPYNFEGHGAAMPQPSTPQNAISDALRVLQPLRVELEELAKFVVGRAAAYSFLLCVLGGL